MSEQLGVFIITFLMFAAGAFAMYILFWDDFKYSRECKKLNNR